MNKSFDKKEWFILSYLKFEITEALKENLG